MSDFIQEAKRLQQRVGVKDDGKIGPATVRAIHAVLDEYQAGVAKPVTMPIRVDLNDGLDARTVRMIETLDPKAREPFRRFARLAKATASTLGCDYVMISGNRTFAEQDALYRQQHDGKDNDGDGKIDEADEKVTRARAGYSNHNFGIAGDFGVFRGKAYLDNADPAMAAKVHRACSVHAAECGLEWGGSWKSFKDLPHYEMRTGLTMAQKRQRMKTHGSVL